MEVQLLAGHTVTVIALAVATSISDAPILLVVAFAPAVRQGAVHGRHCLDRDGEEEDGGEDAEELHVEMCCSLGAGERQCKVYVQVIAVCLM